MRAIDVVYKTNLGHVHTNTFSKTFVFILSKTHKKICVHTRVFIAFSTVHTRPQKRIRNIRFCHQSRGRFCFLRKINACE